MEVDTYTIITSPDDDDQPLSYQSSWFLLIIIFSWVVAGIVAFLWSIMCFGKSGSIAQQLIGLFLAIFFGPFYWVYYYSVKKYCR